MLDQKNRKNRMNESSSSLPAIPDKLYFTIGEVSKLCQLKPHVLRYWEQEFPQLSPNKRRGNRRYYQRRDVLLIYQIKELLYKQGYTIEGARQKLNLEQVIPKVVSAKNMNEVIQRTIMDLEETVELLELQQS